jgi:hypothetical protein
MQLQNVSLAHGATIMPGAMGGTLLILLSAAEARILEIISVYPSMGHAGGMPMKGGIENVQFSLRLGTFPN